MIFKEYISVELSDYIREWTTTKEREQVGIKFKCPQMLNLIVHRHKKMNKKYEDAIYELLKLCMLNRINKNTKAVEFEKKLRQ